MSIASLEPLEFINVVLPTENELVTAIEYLHKQEENTSEFNALQSLYKVKEAFPTVVKLFSIIETFGSSTAISESSFSEG